MTDPPHGILDGITEEVGKAAGRVTTRVALMAAGFLAATLAVIFAFAAAYSGLVVLVGPVAAQLGLALLFAIAAAILFAASSRASRARHASMVRAPPPDGAPPHDDWAGRMAGSVAYAVVEGLAHGRGQRSDPPPSPPPPPSGG